MAGRVAGDARRLERIPASSSVSPPSSRTSASYGRTAMPGRRERGRVLEQRALAAGHVDRRAGALGEVGDAAEVVAVAVRDQDRGAARAERGELEPELARRRRPGRRRPPRARRARRGRRSSSSRSGRARAGRRRRLIERESTDARRSRRCRGAIGSRACRAGTCRRSRRRAGAARPGRPALRRRGARRR